MRAVLPGGFEVWHFIASATRPVRLALSPGSGKGFVAADSHADKAPVRGQLRFANLHLLSQVLVARLAAILAMAGAMPLVLGVAAE